MAAAAGQQQSCLVRLGDNEYSAFSRIVSTLSGVIFSYNHNIPVSSGFSFSFPPAVCLILSLCLSSYTVHTIFPQGQDFSIFRVYLLCDKLCFLCSSGRRKQHGLAGQTKEW